MIYDKSYLNVHHDFFYCCFLFYIVTRKSVRQYTTMNIFSVVTMTAIDIIAPLPLSWIVPELDIKNERTKIESPFFLSRGGTRWNQEEAKDVNLSLNVFICLSFVIRRAWKRNNLEIPSVPTSKSSSPISLSSKIN